MRGARAGRAAAAGSPDEAARQLHHQALLLEGLCAKAARAGGLVDAARGRLRECAARLAGDLRAKGAALSIDAVALGVRHGGDGGAPPMPPPPGGAPAAPLGGGGGEGGGGAGAAAGARRRWEGDSAALAAGAHELVAEGGRSARGGGRGVPRPHGGAPARAQRAQKTRGAHRPDAPPQAARKGEGRAC